MPCLCASLITVFFSMLNILEFGMINSGISQWSEFLFSAANDDIDNDYLLSFV